MKYPYEKAESFVSEKDIFRMIKIRHRIYKDRESRNVLQKSLNNAKIRTK